MLHAGKPAMVALPCNALLHNGRYRVIKELNRGGTAIVYEAEDLQKHELVALKVITRPGDQVPIKVVKREIGFSSTVVHENIVRLLDVFAEKQQLVIVWELISGPDLLDLLNECGGRMREDMAAFYFVQLVRAVIFMHDNGFCHRDIKPENCMIERSSCRLKLIDFGLSKHLDSAQTLGIGTPDYMSPELLDHSAKISSRAGHAGRSTYDAAKVDAWAMGVMMYLLLTGRYPFDDPNNKGSLLQTINNVRLGRMQPLPSTVSPECAELIKGLLQPDPQQRMRLHELLRDPWLHQQSLGYARSIGKEEYLGVPDIAMDTLDTATAPTIQDAMQVDESAAGAAEQLPKQKSKYFTLRMFSNFLRKKPSADHQHGIFA